MMDHLIKVCMKPTYSKHVTLGDIERSNQGHGVFIGLYTITMYY